MKAKPSKRRILVISSDAKVGNWLRFSLAGLNTRLPTTVVSDLHLALRALRRLHPEVVIFVETGSENVDQRLLLLRALLIIEKLRKKNTLAMVYNLADRQLTMYHNIHLSDASLEDVVLAAREGRECPLFGYSVETASCFPQNCGFLPLMVKSADGTEISGSKAVMGAGGPKPKRKKSRPDGKTIVPG